MIGDDLTGEVPAFTAAILGSRLAPEGPNERMIGSFSSSLSEKFCDELRSLDCVSKLCSAGLDLRVVLWVPSLSVCLTPSVSTASGSSKISTGGGSARVGIGGDDGNSAWEEGVGDIGSIERMFRLCIGLGLGGVEWRRIGLSFLGGDDAKSSSSEETGPR